MPWWTIDGAKSPALVDDRDPLEIWFGWPKPQSDAGSPGAHLGERRG